MQLYRERLWPSAWVFISTALVVPASLLVFLPINAVAGVVVAIVLYAGTVVILIVASPTIVVTKTEVVAGRARLPIGFSGDAEVFRAAEATLERGQRLDARAWLVIRGWVSPVVKLPVTDPADPAPYWLISSRRPEQMAKAVATAKDLAAGNRP